MKLPIKIILIVTLSLSFLFVAIKFATGLYFTKNWNKLDTEIVSCSKSNYIKIKDIEGNSFVFVDTSENSNLKTNNITFNEKKLGIKSLAKVNNSDPSINYLSKNDKLSYDELVSLQECYKNYTITISNNYNFEKSNENKFCSFIFKNDKNYEISDCE